MVAALAVLAVFFGAAVTVMHRNRPETAGVKDAAAPNQPAAAPVKESSSAAEADSKSKVVLDEFRRSETRDGKKLWEVSAKHGRYFPENNTAQLSDAELLFYRKDGEQVALHAKYADLFFNSFSLDRAELSGGITLNYKDELSAKTATASFSRETNTIRAPGEVRIRHKMAKIRGEDFLADMTLGQMTLGRKVDTVLFTGRGKDREAK